MHPDAFENQKVQESLLLQHINRQEWNLFNLRLAVLTELRALPTQEMWNIIVRNLLVRHEFDKALKALEVMRWEGWDITIKTASCFQQAILRPRQKGHRPVALSKDFRDLEISISFLKRTIESGTLLPPTLWREILRRLGMMGRLEELE